MTNFRTLLPLFILLLCSSQIFGQDIGIKHKEYTADFIIAVGTSSILGEGNRGYTQLQSYGSYEISGAHFYEFGLNVKKKLKRNSLSLGLHTGAWSYRIEGYEYIFPQNFFEDVKLAEERFEDQVNFQRISIPLSFIIEPKNINALNVRHEIGMIADIIIHNNYGDVSQSASSRIPSSGNFDDILFCGVGYPNTRNAGMRLFYGVSANITPKLSIDSKIKFGGFASQVGSSEKPLLDPSIRADFFYSYFHESLNYRVFEMGIGLKYDIF